MRKLLLAAIALALGLAGCTQPDGSKAAGMVGSPAWHMTATREAKMMTYRSECEGYGFVPGTPQMAYCMQSTAQGSKAAAAAQWSNAMEDFAEGYAASQPVRLQTSCTTFGNHTSCY